MKYLLILLIVPIALISEESIISKINECGDLFQKGKYKNVIRLGNKIEDDIPDNYRVYFNFLMGASMLERESYSSSYERLKMAYEEDDKKNKSLTSAIKKAYTMCLYQLGSEAIFESQCDQALIYWNKAAEVSGPPPKDLKEIHQSMLDKCAQGKFKFK